MSVYRWTLKLRARAFGARACRLVQPKKILGDFEIDDQSGAIDQRGDKRCGNHRRVDADPFKHHRDDRRDNRAPQGNAYQRQADDQRDFHADAHHPGAQAARQPQR